jgi:ABC-type polysaccharide/polyol phosphate transport system ATPase subunit
MDGFRKHVKGLLMCSDIAISVKNISKTYQIYSKPQDRLKQALFRGRRKYYKDFKALDDVSFDVKKGETIGIVGKNGSGKSTLLQIICGTVAPTSGSVECNGRVAALLELGAGFDPDFSGKENVYLNGAVLGLSKKEITARYDDIVEFAEIGDFIDQPVKTYSSGMYVRLAFAIAISVDPEILVVDEALSVGDINFRNKCMQRIKQLRDKGVTVFFVSHDLGTVQTICDRAIWLSNGEVEHEGPSVEVCQEFYADMIGGKFEKEESKVVVQQPSEAATFTKLTVNAWNTHDGLPLFYPGENIEIAFELEGKAALDNVVFGLSIYRDDGDWLIGQTSKDEGVVWSVRNNTIKGKFILTPNILAPAKYFVALAAYTDDFSICYALTDLTSPFSVRTNYPVWGKVIAPCRWEQI